ncbi:hypothetical protein LY41_003217 [Prauserella halophila]|nr:hypothetical protein [Prauserella halophila]
MTTQSGRRHARADPRVRTGPSAELAGVRSTPAPGRGTSWSTRPERPRNHRVPMTTRDDQRCHARAARRGRGTAADRDPLHKIGVFT